MHSLTKILQDILICPQCGGKLTTSMENTFVCKQCEVTYYPTDDGRIDLRLKNQKKVQLEFSLGNIPVINSRLANDSLQSYSSPQLSFEGVTVPHHLTPELLSYFPKALTANSLMLDLGCGNTIHKAVCQHAGFEYVGMDYSDPKAPILGDAHSLPFEDNSFEFTLSVAVLEHIQYPFVMIKEVARVLKPGGTFIGSVAFLEPFHGNSYYHHTWLGLANMLQYGGFDIVQLAPGNNWQVFDAQSRMSAWAIFPGLPRSIARIIILLPKVFSRFWWLAWHLFRNKKMPNKNLKVFTGSFCFIARKKSDL